MVKRKRTGKGISNCHMFDNINPGITSCFPRFTPDPRDGWGVAPKRKSRKRTGGCGVVNPKTGQWTMIPFGGPQFYDKSHWDAIKASREGGRVGRKRNGKGILGDILGIFM